LGFKLRKFEALLSEDGQLPKHVEGNIICMYFTCFVCANSWFCNNKKYNMLPGMNNI